MPIHTAVTKRFDVASNAGLPSGTSMLLRRLSTRLLSTLAFALLVAAAPHAVAQHTSRKEHKRLERAQIVDMEHQWQRAALADDIPEMDRLLSEDYLGITATGEVLTKTQQLDRMRDRKFAITKLLISETKIKLVGNVAIVTCLAHVEGMNDGDVLHGAYRYTRIYQRVPGGTWKVTSFEVTPAMRSGPDTNTSD